jgi:hypothetical protein
MKLLLEKTGVTIQRIYQMIDGKKREHNFTISKEAAAYLIAAEKGIDISKILSEKELEKLRGLREPTISVRKEEKMPDKKAQAQVLIEVERDFHVIDPFLDKKMINEAAQMTRVYPVLYLFENSVRRIIQHVLEKKYGADWWNNKVPRNVRDNVEKRLVQEASNKWHGRRGAHKIFYTDIGDLSSIITTNWLDFKDMFPNQTWVKSRIDEIELSRNIVAHNNPLTDRDIKRVKLYFDDWTKQIGEHKMIKKEDEKNA